jgi:hypothetical protein
MEFMVDINSISMYNVCILNKEMQMDKDSLRQFVQDNPKLVTMRETSTPGLFVIKYSKRVFFDNLWNEFLEECRGLIVDADWNPVVRPFKKVYNFGENGASYDRDRMVYVERKVNGFMGAATYVSSVDQVIYSTTGSLDSDFAVIVRKWLSPYEQFFRYHPNRTFLFEVCDKSDPHIIPEVEGVYLIGARNAGKWDNEVRCANTDMLDWYAKYMGGGILRPSHSVQRFGDVVQQVKTCYHEGFIVYPVDSWETDAGLKIKSKYYLIQKALARKKDIMTLNKQLLDEEFYPLVDHLNGMKDEFNAMDEQSRLDYMRKFLQA